MYLIDEHVACAVAGITADANILINQARLHAQRYRFSYQEAQPVEQARAARARWAKKARARASLSPVRLHPLGPRAP